MATMATIMNLWRQFWALSVWAKVGIVGSWATVVVLAAVIVVLATGGGEPPTQARLPELRPTPNAVSDVLAVPTATRLPPTEAPAPTKLPDRNDCDAIRGTDYRSPTEREWFLANCVPQVRPAVNVAEGQPPPVVNELPQQQPPQQPSPQQPPPIVDPFPPSDRFSVRAWTVNWSSYTSLAVDAFNDSECSAIRIEISLIYYLSPDAFDSIRPYDYATYRTTLSGNVPDQTLAPTYSWRWECPWGVSERMTGP